MIDRDLLKGLRSELRSEGYFERPTARMLLEFCVHATIAFAAAGVAIATHNTWVRAAGVIVSSIATLGAGMVGHSSSHCSVARQRWANEALTYVAFPVFLGLSATWWWHKHVAVHHPAPNVIGVDGDADLSPWFAVTSEQARAGGRLRRFYYKRLQWAFFPLLLGITGFRMQAFGWQYVIDNLRQGSRSSRKALIDLASLSAHYLVWLVVPSLAFSFSDVVAVYAVRVICIGYGMFAILGPGHFPLEAAAITKESRKGDYILLQTASTVNFRAGWFGRLVCGGLEYQIEHHLFPEISHPHYPRVARHVEAFCRAHGYPYRCYSWGRAIWEALRVFYEPKPVQKDLEALRVAPEVPE